ncbi:MAG: pyridoxamine 5'-phosphate oxidase family protein [Alphaproteobacteria bacterium]|nr:pyridoxamine 5'-phosphate oxidase family protein [Alphaproteobacteria bacterium]
MTEQDEAQDLLATAEAAFVTTIDRAGRPRTRAMFNLRNVERFPGPVPPGFETWFTTNTASPKMREIAANPAIAAYYCRPDAFRGLMLGGDVEVVDDPAIKARLWRDGWEMYYPEGPTDPDYAVLRLRPSLVTYYSRLRTTVLAGRE